MKHTLAALFFLVSSLALADRDVIPLNKPTKPQGSFAESGPITGAKRGGAPKQDPQKAIEAAMPKPYVAGIDTFGSDRINETILKQTLGKDLDTWIARGLAGDPSSTDLEAKLVSRVKNKFGFASAEWSVMQFYEPGDLAVFLTLDVVEKKDVADRMPFLAAPTGDFRDPDGLLKYWQEYEDVALELIETGLIEPESEECVAFHCPFGHKHVRLRKYERLFVDGVKKNEKILSEILTKDKKPESRASAAFLLAYLKDGKKVVSMLVDRVKDPHPHVRNNALRVLGDVAEFHSQYIIPIRPLLEALKFPRVSDRAKASYVVHLMALNSQQARDEVLKSGVPSLIALMSSKQPDQRDLAHATLRKVSGKEFPATDVASWNAWYTKIPKDRGVSTKVSP